MSVFGELRVSLNAIDVEQQASLFLFLISYPLALGELLGQRGKRVARGATALSVVAFAALTDPWIHGVLLAVMLVVGMGLFIVSVYLIDMLPRLVPHGLVPQAQAASQPVLAAQTFAGNAATEVVREREGQRAPALAGQPAGTP